MPNSSDFSSATRRGFLATTGGVLAGAVTAPRGLAATVPQSDESSTPAKTRRKIPIGVFDPAFPDLTLDQLVEKYASMGVEAAEIGTGGGVVLRVEPGVVGVERQRLDHRLLQFPRLRRLGQPARAPWRREPPSVAWRVRASTRLLH